MKIIVVGAGKVGYSLCERLVQDDHDVYLIDRSQERIHNLENMLDVSLVCGNGSDIQLLNEIGMSDVGIFIAVTDSDEVNMLSCAVAKIAGVPSTVARVRDTNIAENMDDTMKARLGVDLFINPEMVTAQELLHIIETPSALDVEEFGQGSVRLIEFKINSTFPLINKPLKELTFPEGVLLVGILRLGEMIIPHGESILLPNDSVFFLGLKDGVDTVEQQWFSNHAAFHKRAIIIGAGLLGRNLAVLLEKSGFTVKVIEKDIERCEALAAQVDKAIIINGDGTDFDLLEAEEVADNDVIIALTDDDKLNLLVALVGKHMGIPKTVVRVGRPEYIMLMEQVGIDIVFSPRLMTAGQILRIVRSGEGVVSISTFEGGKAESIEILITDQSPVAGKQLKDIRLPGKALVGVILRGDEAIVPRGNTEILVGDHIVLFTLPESVTKLLNYLT
ncbi:Trk system potassium transport protein TrkA [Veillonella tobetsuensis]|uniref:Trk system potassium uptake protein TrkA n=1 Tax=Veillonella tobetsuensis TaxID=1110546 RepID=A0A480B7J6_9FIRM|nr:Trk system potassium transporter TrkA [Veillonella tobetsuensis]GCL68257.1 Trk system potassium transport protein TrkA [Veillonella tobetsuensis]